MYYYGRKRIDTDLLRSREGQDKRGYRAGSKSCRLWKESHCDPVFEGKATTQLDYLSVLEPDIRLFRFEKKDKYYEDLTEEEKQEENLNIRNGLNFARKVLITEECEMLILDEILSALELGIVSEDEVKGLIEAKDDETELILTGTMITEGLKEAADRVVSLEIVK